MILYINKLSKDYQIVEDTEAEFQIVLSRLKKEPIINIKKGDSYKYITNTSVIGKKLLNWVRLNVPKVSTQYGYLTEKN